MCSQKWDWNAWRPTVNTDAPWPEPDVAWWRVQKIQTKLHQWAIGDPDRRFDDLWNLVYEPAVLVNAWERVRSNRGARSAGIDGRDRLLFMVQIDDLWSRGGVCVQSRADHLSSEHSFGLRRVQIPPRPRNN